MNRRGYINLVVLEDSPQAEALQEAWVQYANEYLHDPADHGGQCATFSLNSGGTCRVLPAVFGTTWGTNDLYDTALGMAQEMHRRFGANTPPLLATVHYNDSLEVHVKAFWSIHEKDHGWWTQYLSRFPNRFGFNAPFFLKQGVLNALKGDRPEAMHFHARLREEQLEHALPQARVMSSLSHPRF